MNIAYVCIIHSSYYNDTISKIYKIFSDEISALKCKRKYERMIEKNKGLMPPQLNSESTNEDYDLYNDIDMSNKFISFEIQQYIIEK